MGANSEEFISACWPIGSARRSQAASACLLETRIPGPSGRGGYSLPQKALREQ